MSAMPPEFSSRTDAAGPPEGAGEGAVDDGRRWVLTLYVIGGGSLPWEIPTPGRAPGCLNSGMVSIVSRRTLWNCSAESPPR